MRYVSYDPNNPQDKKAFDAAKAEMEKASRDAQNEAIKNGYALGWEEVERLESEVFANVYKEIAGHG